ncbi:MAG: hypothetical protein KIT31_03865, partial [Deltaproteobacteria bacterium]|nr:hypothetical protein [Deltaproteobacteria bacterium]
MLPPLLAAVTAAACGAPPPPPPPPPDAPLETNVAAADYVGPQVCGECHPDEHARWSGSLHAVMNQRAGDAAVIGDFATSLAYRGGVARFERDGDGAHTMTLSRPGRVTLRYRVTRTIGARGLQEYVGFEESPTSLQPGGEVRLPFAWWPRGRGWYPQPYFDPWLAEDDFDAYAPVREPWAERCPWCHSTYPFEQRIGRASAREVGHGLEQHFRGAPGAERLDIAQQVTVGISCESCHLGGRAHAAGGPIHMVPIAGAIGAVALPGAPVPSTFAAERRDPAIVNAACAQCHSGPSPRFPDGSATRNSSEALDLARSACTTARCVDC